MTLKDKKVIGNYRTKFNGDIPFYFEEDVKEAVLEFKETLCLCKKNSIPIYQKCIYCDVINEIFGDFEK